MSKKPVKTGGEIVQQLAGQMTGQAEFLLYQTEDAQTRVQLRLQGDTVWMTQRQLAKLYQVSVPTINGHLRVLYQDGDLADRTIRKFRIVAREAARDVERLVDHYSLEVILHLGYRVRSHRGVQFRRWVTEQLQSYLEKGFLLDDDRFKAGQDGEYFQELLARIRDIRSSEKEFWKKVLDIYATSIDYDPHTKTSQQFFATVQNKMHWAAHGHTAAELIAQRVDAQAPNMGLTSWTGARKGTPVRKADVGIAKNYLNAEELDTLNRIVTAYIEVAELQAQSHLPMTMHDWAQVAYAEYQARVCNLPSSVEKDFEAAIAQPIKQLEQQRKRLPKKKREMRHEASEASPR